MAKRDIIIKHKLKMDTIIVSVRKELKELMNKKVFSKAGLKAFQSDPELFLAQLQAHIASKVLDRELPKIIKMSENYKKEMEDD